MGSLAAAWRAFWRVLRGEELVPKTALPPAPAAVARPPAVSVAPPPPPPGPDRFAEGALYTLLLLQREGRLVDFLMEDLGGASDEQIGMAVRRIHDDCAKVLRETFKVAPVRPESEGDVVQLAAGFDAAAVKLTGSVPAAPPYRGTLAHRGWRAAEPALPQRTGKVDPTVIQPAEVAM